MASRASYRQQQQYFYDSVLSPALGTGLWESFPMMAVRSDPNVGQLYEQRFLDSTPASNTIGGWTATQATSGTAVLDATDGLKIDPGAVTASQGLNLQMTRVNHLPTATKGIYLEAKLKFTILTSLNIQFFFGFAAASTALIASAALSTTTALVGFGGVTTTGVILANACNATSTTTGTGLTLVNTTYYVLGIYATTTFAQFWVNHLLASTITATIPAVAMAPTLVVQANGTVEPIVYCNWLRSGSLY